MLRISQKLDKEDLNLIYAIRLTYDYHMEYRYVGLTSVGKRRLSAHANFRGDPKLMHNEELYSWIIANSNQITFDILEIAKSPNDLHMLERKWIHILKEKGYQLFNKTAGGQGVFGTGGISHHNYGKVHTNETKLKMSNASKGRSKSREHAENISKGKKGQIFSNEHRQNISKGKQGQSHPQSEETRERIRKTLTGTKRPKEVGEKISRANHLRHHMNKNIYNESCKWCNGYELEEL